MDLAKQLAELCAEKSKSAQFAGAVLIRNDQEELLRAAYGYANRSWQVPNRVDTRFRVASISKMFTAVAVLQLIEAGQLALDTRIVERLGLEKTTIPPEATVYHLLTMTSGMADWFDESTDDWAAAWAALCRENPIYLLRDNADYLPLFAHKPPLNPVGAKHQYNGAGYMLLGLLIERSSGLPYFDYVRQHIFARAGMTRSDFLALDDVHEEVAEGYIPITDDNKRIGWKRNIYSTTAAAAADGGATSTVDDLYRFAQALRNGQLLSAEMTHAMLTPKVLQDDEQFRGYTWMYGYGNFFLLDASDQIVRWGHTGEEDGVSGRLYHYPRQNLDVSILGNQSWCAGSLAWEIHDLIVASSLHS
ncbi:MAG: beta-lactamase family protein [Caldilineaceae bacterium]|nr:beta-lactamase family protein [Caldilineaceae bacterium]